MSSRLYLRELIDDRLTVAAEDIFRAFELTIDEYEEELVRLRKLLKVERKHRGVTQQQDCNEEVLLDQYLSNQVGDSSLDHVEPDSLHMKEDGDEIPICQKELNQEASTLFLTPDNWENGQTEAEPGRDNQLSLSSPVVKNQAKTGSKDVEKKNIKAEDDLDYQQKSLGKIWQPRIQIHRLELPQLHVSKKEEVLSDRQHCQQHKNQSHQKIGISQKSLTGRTIVLTSHNEESHHMETETDSDHQCLSPVGEGQDHTEITLRDSGSLSETQMTHPEKMRQNKEGKHPESNIGSNTRKEKVSYKCDTCGKTLSDFYKLMRHLRIHTGEKLLTCECCGKCFNHGGNLKRHMRTHSGEKPFSCQTCGKCFKKSESLKTHMRTHTGEKPYSCETCGKCFNKSEILKTHMRTHTGEKPFSCEICGKCFSDCSTLRVHLRTHTGERPYACETCGKRFTTNSSRNVHTRLGKCDKSEALKTCEIVVVVE